MCGIVLYCMASFQLGMLSADSWFYTKDACMPINLLVDWDPIGTQFWPYLVSAQVSYLMSVLNADSWVMHTLMRLASERFNIEELFVRCVTWIQVIIWSWMKWRCKPSGLVHSWASLCYVLCALWAVTAMSHNNNLVVTTHIVNLPNVQCSSVASDCCVTQQQPSSHNKCPVFIGRQRLLCHTTTT